MKWAGVAGHMVRMKDDRLPKISSETKKQEGCRKRGRSQLRWEDCMKSALNGRGRREGEEKGQQHGAVKDNNESSRTAE